MAGLGSPDTPADALADELTFWVLDNLPSWRDNEPYYALRQKAKELFDTMAALDARGDLRGG